MSMSACAVQSALPGALQDPLAELVKIDPKSIGVGQYQHDVNQSDSGPPAGQCGGRRRERRGRGFEYRLGPTAGAGVGPGRPRWPNRWRAGAMPMGAFKAASNCLK